MSEHHLMVIGAERVDAPEATEVRSPYDGRVLGTVPTGTTEHIDAAVAAANAVLVGGPLPTHERASILDRLAEAVALLEKGWRVPSRAREHHLRRAYALADLYERSGAEPRARELFVWVRNHDPGFADVAARVRALS